MRQSGTGQGEGGGRRKEEEGNTKEEGVWRKERGGRSNTGKFSFRGSLVALGTEIRPRYVALVRSLLAGRPFRSSGIFISQPFIFVHDMALQKVKVKTTWFI